MTYDTLFTPVSLGPIELENRIMSSGHQTTLVHDNLPTADFHSYHQARADGGVGLIVLEAHAVHESGVLTDHTIDAGNDAIVDEYRGFADRIHAEGTKVFAQLIHSGREVYDGDYAPPPPAPAPVPSDRLHTIPRPLETDEIADIVDGFGDAAERMAAAGIDGVEVVGSHGYLPAQFWSPYTNDRDDGYGGDLPARCRFTTEVVERIRDRVPRDFVVGIRLSAEERHERGLTFGETLPIIEHLDEAVDLDYWSLVVGSSSSHRGCNYIVPPSTEDPSVVSDPGAVVRETVDGPVVVTSRINTPAKAESILSSGSADVVGMTRALIADPDLPRKVAAGEWDDVTPCVACNQGCIGRYQDDLPIRCTVNPETGREREYRGIEPADATRRVLVVGGGPAGLVAAATAGRRGHDVTLVEREETLGGQVDAYADLDHRDQYDRWIDVLERRLHRAGVDVKLGTKFEADDLSRYSADDVILATGSTGRVPDVPIADEAEVSSAVAALTDPAAVPGGRVVVSDWDGNWATFDVARHLVGREDVDDVEIVTSGYSAGENVQQYVRNSHLGDLHEAGVTFTPHHRVGEVGPSSVTLVNIFNESRSDRDEVDSVVFSHLGEADHSLYRVLRSHDVDVHRVGDCWAPRSLDEATWEGYRTAVEL